MSAKHHAVPIHSKAAIHSVITNIPIVSPRATIREIKKLITDDELQYESINYIYVVNNAKQLQGVLSIKEVMQLPESTAVGKVMNRQLIFAHPHTRQETAAHLALKHNIKAVPVIAKDKTFVGIIPSDIILRITSDEITEDLLRSEGIHSKQYRDISTLANTPLHLLVRRLPWLIVGLAGGMVAAQIVGIFETLFDNQFLLIRFLPLMVYMSDAVGSQSQTIFIRYIAIHNGVKFSLYLIKEIVVGILIATSLAVLLAIIATALYDSYLGMVLGVSLFSTIVVSVATAVIIPYILIRLQKDPAIGSGPFATIVRDILSIVAYFSVSHIFYSGM